MDSNRLVALVSWVKYLLVQKIDPHYENKSTNLVSTIKNVVFYAFLVVRIY